MEQKQHHFLYYIFRFDKKQCKMDETKVKNLKAYLLQIIKKGE